MKRNDWICLFASASLWAAAGCAAGNVNQEKLSEVQAAVRAAEELGAEGHPDAALHLKLAKEQIATAESLYRDDEKARGARMLERAEADAELALALAKVEDVREEAREAKEKVEKLKREGL